MKGVHIIVYKNTTIYKVHHLVKNEEGKKIFLPPGSNKKGGEKYSTPVFITRYTAGSNMDQLIH